MSRRRPVRAQPELRRRFSSQRSFVSAPVLALLPLLLATWLASPESVRSAVTWQGLWAESDDRSITLIWETGTEFDNLGFYVLRAERASGPFARRDGSWTLAQGGMIGSTYRWTDQDVRGRKAYYYLVESISQSNEVERHGRNGAPVCAMLNGEACPAAASESPTSRPAATETPRASGPAATSAPPSPTRDGPTPVRVPTGARGDDYGGSRSAPAATAAPSRTPRGGSTPAGDAERATEAPSRSRGRLVTAPARSGASRRATGTPAALAARAGGAEGGGQAREAERSRDASSSESSDAAADRNAGASSAESRAIEGASAGAGAADDLQRSGDSSPDPAAEQGGSAAHASDSSAAEGGSETDAFNPWMLLLMGALVLGLGLRVWTLARSR